MRVAFLLSGLMFCVGCGDKIDHPEAADDCDPALQDCGSSTPPPSASTGGGKGGGTGQGSTDQLITWSGQVIAYADDTFNGGRAFSGTAEVSAAGLNGARVKAPYDGTAFKLSGVLKTETNWFLVQPQANAGVLPTLSPADTRVALSGSAAVGMAAELDVDSIFALSLSGSERATTRAQIVVRVVDDQDRSVAGVIAAAGAEVIAYRSAEIWTLEDSLGTDDSGLLFLGNLPASSNFSDITVNFSGSVSARVDARILAGAVTVITAVVAAP